MSKHRKLVLLSLVLVVAVVAWSLGHALAKKATANPVTLDDQAKKFGKVTPSEQKAAAKRARDLGLKPGVAGLNAAAAPTKAAPAEQMPQQSVPKASPNKSR